jgi:hypothetical protein
MARNEPPYRRCHPCPKGTFNPDWNSTQCYVCDEVNTDYTTAGPGAINFEECFMQCQSGFRVVAPPPDIECAPCPAGTYSRVRLGHYSGETECTPCDPKVSTSQVGSFACDCFEGYMWDGVACAPVAARG